MDARRLNAPRRGATMSTVYPIAVEYPESDGKPIAETPVHRDNMFALIDVLRHRHEDLEEKFVLYRDTLRVPEFFLWDPLGEYLDPSLRGYGLIDGQYAAIEPVDRRLPSEVLRLHFEAGDRLLRLYDPVTGQTLLTSAEAREVAERARRDAEQGRLEAEREVERLRLELEALRRQSGGAGHRSQETDPSPPSA
jgi:hypothetical protein